MSQTLHLGKVGLIPPKTTQLPPSLLVVEKTLTQLVTKPSGGASQVGHPEGSNTLEE